MPRLRAPLLSGDARGKLNPALQFQKRHGSIHLTRPTAHKIAWSQTTIRNATFAAALAANWQTYHQLISPLWAEIAQTKRTDPYHAYLATNHERWSAGAWPVTDPTENPHPTEFQLAVFDVTAYHDFYELKLWTMPDYKTAWFIIAYGPPPGFPTMHDLTWGIYPSKPGGTLTFQDHHPQPNAAYIYAIAIDAWGNRSQNGAYHPCPGLT
jgi:hypothetical protein